MPQFGSSESNVLRSPNVVSRRERRIIVFDTNVFVRALMSRSKTSPNHRVLRLWLVERELQLVVSAELLSEYLEVFEQVLGMTPEVIAKWRQRFTSDTRISSVNLGTRYKLSRDPDDNLVLATAAAGRASWLLTNDKDLLELPDESQKLFRYEITTPHQFLQSATFGD